LPKHVGVNLEYIIKIYNALEDFLVISHRYVEEISHKEEEFVKGKSKSFSVTSLDRA
jgi:hypothetical protein